MFAYFLTHAIFFSFPFFSEKTTEQTKLSTLFGIQKCFPKKAANIDEKKGIFFTHLHLWEGFNHNCKEGKTT